MAASSLGAFQFDNLVQGRIPFLFINLGVEITPLYQHMYKMHLERYSLPLGEKDVSIATAEEIITGIQAMQYPQASAIVVADSDATKSLTLAESLENAGFTNVFFLRGGWQQLAREKAEGF